MQSADRKYPFVSALLTGTGSEVPVAHGLNGIPDDVWINLTDSTNTYVKGTHTGSVIKVNVTNAATYRIYAGFLNG